jgi:hypothetical protein
MSLSDDGGGVPSANGPRVPESLQPLPIFRHSIKAKDVPKSSPYVRRNHLLFDAVVKVSSYLDRPFHHAKGLIRCGYTN